MAEGSVNLGIQTASQPVLDMTLVLPGPSGYNVVRYDISGFEGLTNGILRADR